MFFVPCECVDRYHVSNLLGGALRDVLVALAGWLAGWLF